jgi:predicted ATPase
MINMVLILKPWRCFTGEECIKFKPGVNLIVGDQGSGKSSLFQAIQLRGMKKHASWKLPPIDEVPAIIDFRGGPIQSFIFDFEHDSYRTKPFFDGDTMFHVNAMHRSHGEMVVAMFKTLEEIDKPIFVLVDEPDMALSIRSCLRLVRIFKHVAELGGQVIATAHNPVVIGGFEEVYSIEHGEWMPSQKYIDTQMEPVV